MTTASPEPPRARPVREAVRAHDLDEMMSAENVTSIHGFYTGAPKSMRRLTPSELGVRKVGHFGFFRPEMEYPLWRARLYPELAQSASSLRASA